MAKKPQLTSHKSRFETLEDRRLLTTFNVTAPMTAEGQLLPRSSSMARIITMAVKTPSAITLPR